MLFERTDPETLRARLDAAAQVVERRLREQAEAVSRYLEESGSPAAAEQLDAADELLYLAQWELRRADAALTRAERPWWMPHLITWRSAR
jgi:hypothetical protein